MTAEILTFPSKKKETKVRIDSNGQSAVDDLRALLVQIDHEKFTYVELMTFKDSIIRKHLAQLGQNTFLDLVNALDERAEFVED